MKIYRIDGNAVFNEKIKGLDTLTLVLSLSVLIGLMIFIFNKFQKV